MEHQNLSSKICGWTLEGKDMFAGSLCSVESCIECTERV